MPHTNKEYIDAGGYTGSPAAPDAEVAEILDRIDSLYEHLNKAATMAGEIRNMVEALRNRERKNESG